MCRAVTTQSIFKKLRQYTSPHLLFLFITSPLGKLKPWLFDPEKEEMRAVHLLLGARDP